jgi:gamma-glutamyltranspeptidase/glutathione hydrolase
MSLEKKNYDAAKLEFLSTKRPPAFGTRGAVTSPHYLATEAGKKIVQQGGHAVEGAIATNAVLTVVYPHMAGLGGDLMALIWDKEHQKVSEINGTGHSGEHAVLDAYSDYEVVPERGPMSAITVPGTVEAWWDMHKKYGKLEWKELFKEAIHYAKNGFPISMNFSDYIEEKLELLEENKEAYKTYVPNGEIPREGDILIQSDLAYSLELIAKEGPDAFYNGEITDKIIASLEKHGGLLTREDFQEYEATWDRPVETEYRGYTIWHTRPNSQGAAATILLNILENFDLKEIGDNTINYYHLMSEATKLAFIYRDQYITDEDEMDIDPRRFAKDKLGERLANEIHFDKLTDETVDHDSLPKFKTGDDTTYMAVVDNEGNTCSLIQSIYHEFGSGFMPEGTGIILQNRGESFELDENHPNSLKSRKQPFHTIIPVLMTENNKPVMLYGTMGGEGQPQTQAAIVTRVVDFGYNIQQAIEAPRWLYGRTWGDDSDSLKLEGRISDEIIEMLERIGHEVERDGDYSDQMGHAQGIIINQETGVMSAGADPRGDGIGLSW